MEPDIAKLRLQKINAIRAKQDTQFRWAFDERLAHERLTGIPQGTL